MEKVNLKRLRSSKNERSSKIIKNVIGTLIVKGISIPTQLLLVPLTISYISSELYGIWLTLTSIIGWIGFFDIGFGNGLRNKLTEALANNDIIKGRGYISTTYVGIFLIFTIVGIVGYLLVPFIDWCALLNTSSSYQELIIDVMRIVLVCFCIQMVLKIQSNVWMALQMNAVAGFADALGQVVTLVGIWILTITTFPSMVLMAWVFNGCPILIVILSSIYLYGIKRKDLCPSISTVEKSYMNDIISLGGKFFVIQIAAIITFQMTNIILSNTCGPESVTEFNVVYKYISIANMLMTMVLGPIWSAFTDAYTKGDQMWMMNIYNKLKKIFYLVTLLVIVMVAVYPFVFDIWLGDNVKVSFQMVIAVSLLIISTLWANIHSSIKNGIGKLKFSLWYCNVQTVLSIPVCYYLGKEYGAEGVVWGTIIITLPSMFFSPYQVVHLLRGDAKGIWNK